MLQYTEALLREIRKLRADTEAIVLNGTITDMERYRFLMGRLEGLKLSEDAAREFGCEIHVRSLTPKGETLGRSNPNPVGTEVAARKRRTGS
jgi:hypothetical protein